MREAPPERSDDERSFSGSSLMTSCATWHLLKVTNAQPVDV